MRIGTFSKTEARGVVSNFLIYLRTFVARACTSESKKGNDCIGPLALHGCAQIILGEPPLHSREIKNSAKNALRVV